MANLDAVQAELMQPSVLKEGHLLKLGRSVLKLPKLNYYVLKPSGVFCFKGRQENEEVHSFVPLEEISLSLGTVVEGSNQLHCIKIADRRKMRVLACHSKEKRDSWVTAILTAVAQRLVDEPHLLRNKRIASTCSSSSPDSEVFYDIQCQFTSPFWANQENKRRYSIRGEKSPVTEAPVKMTWSTAGRRRKSLSTSLSLEDIHSILGGTQPQPKMTRKRSMHDLTRYFFGPNKSSGAEDEEKTQNVSHKGKRRWSLFGSSAFPVTATPSQNSNEETKRTMTHCEQESRLIWDTKL